MAQTREEINQYQANLMRKRREASNEIGEIPKPLHPKRRKTAEKDLAKWGAEYCMSTPDSAGLLNHAPSPKMTDYAHNLQTLIQGAGSCHIRCARGSGKTTWVAISVLYGLLTGQIKFAVLFGASQQQASSILRNIWTILENSKKLNEDYPEACFPIKHANSIKQRFLTQTYHGKRTDMRCTNKEVRLPTIEGARSSGGVVKALGAGGAVRGLVDGSKRPDFLLLDDLQSRPVASSPTRINALEEWTNGDVRGLQGATLTRMVITSTPIVKNDYSERFADSTQHPEYLQISYPLIFSEPDDKDLWQRYDEIYKQCLRTGDPNFTAATQFYEANKADMDKGVEMLDDEQYDKRLERSAYQHARNLRLTMGRAAFNAEYMLKCRENESQLTLTAKTVMSRVNGVPHGTMPKGILKICAGIDVNPALGLSYVLMGFGRHQTAVILDYGRVVGKNGRLVPKNATERETAKILSDALYKLVTTIHRLEFRDETGKSHRPGAIWIDRGYLPDIVDKVADLARKRGHPVDSVKGYDSRAFGKYAKTIVLRFGDVDLREWNGNQYYGVNADVSKEAFQAAFLAPPMTPGSVSLYGSDPDAHVEFAEEVTNETLVEKIQGQEIVFYNWTLKPNSPNHYLDAGGYALAAGKRFGFWSSEEVVEGSAGAETPKATRKVAPVRRKRIVIKKG